MKSIVIHRYTRIIGLYQDGFLPKMYVSYCKFIPFYMAYSPKFRHLKFIFVHGYRRIITLLVKSRESFSLKLNFFLQYEGLPHNLLHPKFNMKHPLPILGIIYYIHIELYK